MKKLILICISALFLAACSGKEEPIVTTTKEKPETTTIQNQTQQKVASCTINGHDCWEIIQLLKNTEPVFSTVPETEMYSPDIKSFKNPVLEAEGFSVGYYNSYSDGGMTASILWGESDFVNIGTHYTDKGPHLLLIWLDGTQKELDTQGNVVN